MEDNRIEFIYDLSTETKVILLCGKSDAMPPDEFWTELCDSLTRTHRILRQYPQEILRWGTSSGQELVLQVRHPDYFRAQPTRGPMPVPSDDTNANGIEPLPTLPLPSLHRRRPLRRNLPRPPKNCQWHCRRPPPIRTGEVTELEAGPAAVD